MKKVKFIAFSDLHINDWKLSYEYDGDRLKDGLKALNIINKRAGELKVKMLFGGDMFHRFKSLDNEVVDEFSKVEFEEWIVGIDGNHDQVKANTHKTPSPGWFSSLARMNKKMVCVNYRSVVTGDGYMIHGIPYMKHNVGFKTFLKKADKQRRDNPKLKHILIIHTDLPGAVNGHGERVTTVENVNLKRLKAFDLVLCGHIHVPQIIAKNIIMLGAPYQQNVGEIGEDRGYWEIYEDLSYKFIPITTIPTYRKYDPAKPPKDFSKHIWVKQARKPLEIEDVASKQFDIKQSRKGIAKAYLNVNKQKDKRKRKLLINLIQKTT